MNIYQKENDTESQPYLGNNPVKIQNLLGNKIFLIFAVLVAIIAAVTWVVSVKKAPGKSPSPLIITQKTTAGGGNGIDQKIARVGEEDIYRSDLNMELANYPTGNENETKAIILDKIATDSIILQAGRKEKLVTLDDTFFNSPNKDYRKRIDQVNTVKTAIEKRADKIQGYVVSIWFYNTEPGEAGYEQGKEIAFEKITRLHKDVKEGTVTIREAGERIKNDASLAKVDTGYRGNALMQFSANPGTRITFDEAFNNILWNLSKDGVSQVYLAKDGKRGTNEMIDAVYMFGQVTNRVRNETVSSFSDWLNKQKLIYEIKII